MPQIPNKIKANKTQQISVTAQVAFNCIPINRAFYIDHFSVYITVFLFEKKGKNYKFGKN